MASGEPVKPPERMSAVQFRGLAAREVAKPSKFGNRRVEVDGITFHSAHEGRCYSRLKLRERAGEIRGLRLQPRYDLIVNGRKVTRYVADFEYEERTAEGWLLVTEDAKGAKTKDYVIKRELFGALMGREVRET